MHHLVSLPNTEYISVEVRVYKPLKKTNKKWHCSGNEKIKLKQQSTVNIQNTEDDPKILLRILYIKLYHYFPHILM